MYIVNSCVFYFYEGGRETYHRHNTKKPRITELKSQSFFIIVIPLFNVYYQYSFLLLNSSAWAKPIYPQYNFPHLAHTAQIPSQSAFSKWPLVKTKLHAMYYNALHIFNFFET